MKTHMFITLVGLVCMLSAGLQAQEQLLFRVNVPFEFVAGGIHLSAGEYLAFHTTPTMIQLVRNDGRASAWVLVKASPTASLGTMNQLVFNKYGETYFLSQVRTGHDQQVHECYRCRAEKTMAAQYRSSDVKTIALNAMPAK